MKKSLLLLLLIPIILTSCKKEPEQQESKVISRSEAATTIVYITKTGECYHTESCTSLRKSKIKKKLTEAAKRYRACQNCYPPVIDE